MSQDRSHNERGGYTSEEAQAQRLAGQPSGQPGYGYAGGQQTHGGQQGSDMQQQAGEMAHQAQEQMAQGAEMAKERASQAEEMGRERAADGAERAAGMLRQAGGDNAVGHLTDRAAEGMERTAGYLRDKDAGSMLSDVEEYVRAHPVQGIAGAVAAGFVVGRMLR